jgi:5-histidylcysteine sulfoxide synthase/putative 4-mercaptohistidine N1-methyltranferase
MMDLGLFPRTPRLDGDDAEAVRARLRDYFLATFDRYEQLFEVLADDEAYYRKPISLRHPLIFYYGHTATFFVNKLLLSGLVDRRINPRFESLFAVGVDEMSWDDLDEAHYDWPTVEEVRAYRGQVRALVDGLIREAPLRLPIDWRNPWWAILMGIEHERIHLETSSVLIRQHALRHVKPHPAWPPCRDAGPAPANRLAEVPAGPVRLGKAKDDPYYGWDNEYGVHAAEVAAFQASRMLVSNGEFLAFVEAGGYGEDAYWEEEGRGWKQFARAAHPTFWVNDGGQWRLRLMLEEVPMPWNWPVEVNYHEAKAFCNWKAAQTGLPTRLPSEDEWHRLRLHAGQADDAPANLHLEHFASSCPVDWFGQDGWHDVAGNVWQWTETPIYPYEGFEVHPYYDDFTTPTYDGRHNIIKGGSWISCGNEALSASRYAFRRHFFQHAGFRYVIGEPPPAPPATQYETDPELVASLEQHYGEDYCGTVNTSQALVAWAMQAMAGRPARRAMDLGCAAGRASFELARHFEQVTGIDFSARFIGLGAHLLEHGVIRYALPDEGELVSYKERRLADLGLDGLRGKVEFFQGDACNLKPIFTGYDLILAASLLDRLRSPRKCLDLAYERLKPGGLLLVATACGWQESHTPRQEWLGGFKKDGERFATLDGLKECLAGRFRLVQGPWELPSAQRETRRQFRYALLEVTLWEKLA